MLGAQCKTRPGGRVLESLGGHALLDRVAHFLDDAARHPQHMKPRGQCGGHRGTGFAGPLVAPP
jgi:hypothetical protein